MKAKMRIAASSVPINERDIEDALYAAPDNIRTSTIAGIEKWIARQYKLPSGIADLIGYGAFGEIIVIEVKNVPINKAALTQVARYAFDLEGIMSFLRHKFPGAKTPLVQKLLIGPSIDNQTLQEALAMNIEVCLFEPIMQLSVYEAEYPDRTGWVEQITEIAQRDGWKGAIDTKVPDEYAGIFADAIPDDAAVAEPTQATELGQAIEEYLSDNSSADKESF